jgi:hypothetical protein
VAGGPDPDREDLGRVDNVVVFGPNCEKKYVAPNSSRNGTSVVVAPRDQPQAGEGGGYRREASGLQQPPADPVDGRGGQQVAGQRGHGEDGQRPAGLAEQAGLRGRPA